jgi:hypothetical protein
MAIDKENEIGALWEKVSKAGKVFFSGTINGQSVVVFQNEWKKPGENKPDLRVYKSDDSWKDKRDSQPAADPPHAANTGNGGQPDETDDIPF